MYLTRSLGIDHKKHVVNLLRGVYLSRGSKQAAPFHSFLPGLHPMHSQNVYMLTLEKQLKLAVVVWFQECAVPEM